MPTPKFTKYQPLYDTFTIEDFGVAPGQRINLFSGNPQQASYPNDKALTNMSRQGEIPQGVAFVGRDIKLLVWANFPPTESPQPIADAVQQNLNTLIHGMSAQLRVEGVHEFRNWPLATLTESKYQLRAFGQSPTTPALDWLNLEAPEYWGGIRLGSRLPFGFLPQPPMVPNSANPALAEEVYAVRMLAQRPPLVPFVMRPKQEFAIILEQTDNFAGWSPDANVEVRITALIDGMITTDLDLATGTPSPKALGMPLSRLTDQIRLSPEMQARMTGVSELSQGAGRMI